MSLQMNWANYMLQNYERIPQRVVLSLFGFMAIVNAYTMRFCLDYAFLRLNRYGSSLTNADTFVNATESTITNTGRKEIVRDNIRQRFRDFTSNFTSTTTKTKISNNLNQQDRSKSLTFDWTPQWQLFVFTSFYVGYVVSHIPGGQLAERYGGKWILGMAIMMAGILTLITPVIIRLGSPIALIAIRFFMGVSEGPIFPAVCTLLAQWVPAKERGKLGVFVLSAGQFGIFLVNLISSMLVERFQWSSLFYFFGGCALLWFLSFILLCHNGPDSSPFIRDTEKQYLESEIHSMHNNAQRPPTPWKQIFKSAPMWALIWANMQYDWTQTQARTSAHTWTAADDSHRLKNGEESSDNAYDTVNASLPNILNWLVSLLSGVMSDFLINHNILSTTSTRKMMTALVAVGPNFLLSFRSCFVCSQRQDVATLLNCAIAVMGTYYAGIKLAPLDMSPNYAGTLMAIANGFGSMTALMAPYLQGNSLQHIFQTPFNEVRTLLWLLCTTLITGEIQEFNDPLVTVNKQQ